MKNVYIINVKHSRNALKCYKVNVVSLVVCLYLCPKVLSNFICVICVNHSCSLYLYLLLDDIKPTVSTNAPTRPHYTNRSYSGADDD